MPHLIYTPQSMADLVAEADCRANDLVRAVRRTRDLIDQNRDLFAMHQAGLALGQQLARYALIERLQVNPD